MNNAKQMLLTFAVCFLFSGCATHQMKLTKSGFLNNYEGLAEDKEMEGLFIYHNPDKNIMDKYTKVMISPVQFQLDPQAGKQDISEEDKNKLIDYFDQELTEKLSENYEVVNAPGADVLMIRSAVTDVLPNKVYFNLHWSTTLAGAGIGGASIEVELVDSLTNERILAFIDARKGRRLNYTKGLTKWGHTKEVLGVWANIIVDNLDQLKNKYNAQEVKT